MKNEPVLKLAMSMHANPGVYALLIGSGVSRAADIPTGWEIVLDLIRQMVATEKEAPPSDLEAWYKQHFDEDPDYSKLLDRLTTTSAERMALLCSYFEPNEKEREQELKKIPTPAHRAIATLAKLGYVRMILTTNFDRLIEKALEEEGIVPDVISSDYDLKEVMPYVHSRCVVVKLHGDYRYIHIKNTPEELANYSQEMNNFLDRVFDEFGLVVCGWSSEWDTALRKAILRAPTRRFTTFWLAKGEPTEEAKKIIQHRPAEVIHIKDADQFFTGLLEKVESLRELEHPPISTEVAVATVKRYLVEPQHRVRLRDLVHEETEMVYKELLSEQFDPHIDKMNEEVFQQRMHKYEALMRRLMAMLAALSYHDKGENSHLLTGCIKRLTQVPRRDGKEALVKLQYYPALLLTYAAGISAIAAKRFYNLAAILKEPKYRDFYDERKPTIVELNVESVFTKSRLMPNRNDPNNTPNDYLFELLRPALDDYLPDGTIYEETFNIFEYLLALTYLDIVDKSHSPPGRFEHRGTGYTGTAMRYGVLVDNWDRSPLAEFVSMVVAQGSEGELLKENFFDGSIERFKEVVEIHKKLLESKIRANHPEATQ